MTNKSEIESLTSEVERLEKEKSEGAGKIEKLEQIVSENGSVNEGNDEIEVLRAELSSTLEQLEDASLAAEEAASLLAQLRKIEEKNLELSQTLQKSTVENQTLKNDLEEIRASQISQATLDAKIQAIEEANKTIEGLHNGNKVLQKTIETLEKEKLALKAQFVDGGRNKLRKI